MADTFDARVELGTLFACYGGLLTEKQQLAVRLYSGEDQSLSEIAGQMGVSRQNVHELITRAEQKLRRCEDALHIAEQTVNVQAGLEEAEEALLGGRTEACREILHRLMNELDMADQ
ncbi:MAG TPA: sigma factor-like helix-turn-helix DNA-binding protein [Candidatus Limiplasma sp.]|nr:sigma factor-like helix-turn-helix DNA-binding protein [Candidatus Limiplasma sp.]HRX07528.1 sigma factor-like helix-turn-helix DNA-binding protein [Candidatus Limiplasma sp.]